MLNLLMLIWLLSIAFGAGWAVGDILEDQEKKERIMTVNLVIFAGLLAIGILYLVGKFVKGLYSSGSIF